MPQCYECNGPHATSYGKVRCNLRVHRIQMRIMNDLIEDNDLDDELLDRFYEETGNAPFALAHIPQFDEVEDDTEKLEMQEMKAEADDKERFIAAIADGLRLRKLEAEIETLRNENAEIETLRNENAELRGRVAALEASGRD